jgi:2-polyprenyl-3-methyl-5-hydroxy-6-metoxy-1,4-benzoquinol methylase
MFKQRSTQKEIIDDLHFSSPLLIDNLKEMEKINHWLRFNKTLLMGLEKVKKTYALLKLTLADLGCGSGDTLRCINDWASRKNLSVELHGIDGNAFVVEHAKKASLSYPNIQYLHRNIFRDNSQYDIVTLNNFCHHFTNDELILLLKSLTQQANIAILIHDLHRHFLAYWGFLCLTKFFRFSPITKHDGALSVKRGFVKADLVSLLNKANIDSYTIQWLWPFRWQIIIWCKQNENRN